MGHCRHGLTHSVYRLSTTSSSLYLGQKHTLSVVSWAIRGPWRLLHSLLLRGSSVVTGPGPSRRSHARPSRVGIADPERGAAACYTRSVLTGPCHPVSGPALSSRVILPGDTQLQARQEPTWTAGAPTARQLRFQSRKEAASISPLSQTRWLGQACRAGAPLSRSSLRSSRGLEPGPHLAGAKAPLRNVTSGVAGSEDRRRLHKTTGGVPEGLRQRAHPRATPGSPHPSAPESPGPPTAAVRRVCSAFHD